MPRFAPVISTVLPSSVVPSFISGLRGGFSKAAAAHELAPRYAPPGITERFGSQRPKSLVRGKLASVARASQRDVGLNRVVLGAQPSAVNRLGPVAASPFRLHMAGIDDRPRPLDLN